MKIVSIHDLVVGDVFAKKIQLHGREAHEVIEVPKDKNYLVIKTRGNAQTKNFHKKEGMKVYLLRNINDI